MINIIGGSGFIGTRLAKRLSSQKYDFKIIDKKKSINFEKNCSIADVRSIEEMRQAVTEESIIINLAAEHKDNVSPKTLYYDVNVEGAKNICQIAREKKCSQIIFTSSVAVYGFAPLNTNEEGEINPFNDYGKTKYQAELILKEWQEEDPLKRSLVIIRPTVVFGEGNRGNVYNLLRQIALGFFVMIGDGKNRKSMAYVENVAAFIEYSISLSNGIHVFNYIDKPDFSMNDLVNNVYIFLNRTPKINIKIPFSIGFSIGKFLDTLSFFIKKEFPVSAIRIKKFCANSVYNSRIDQTSFLPR
jgi:nucleoside-diphosphate-sugar epimerase